jgi:succinylglutamate desuccinylase
MPTLKQAVADKKAQEPALRRNPEIDAKLDRFIEENPRLREYYQALSKDDLIRKLMLTKMQRSEYTNGRNHEIRAWVDEHPEIKAKIEERIRNVPEANRERAFLNAAKTEAMNQTVRPIGNGVRP